MSGYNLGVDPEEVVLTLVGFASQHQIFDIVANPNSVLGGVALAFGLVGFVLLVLWPASWNFKAIAGWLLLFLILIVRPIGEPLFFSNASNIAERTLNAPVCYAGNVDMNECLAIQGENPAVPNNRVRDAVAGNVLVSGTGEVNEEGQPINSNVSGNADLSFQVFTPQAAIIHLINDLNYGIAVSLSDLGPRALDRHFASIETLRRAANSDQPSAYNMSEFIATCGVRVPEAAEYAYVTSADLKRQNPDLWETMAETPMMASDGLQLYTNYANYARSLSPEIGNQLVPALICAPGASNCPGNVYDRMPNRNRVLDEDEFEEALQPLLFSGDASDFEGPQTNIRDTMTDLRANITSLGEDAFEKLNQQPVTLIVPVNAQYIASSSQSADALGMDNVDDLAEFGRVTLNVITGALGGAGVGAVGGALTGALAGCAVGGAVGTVVPILGNIAGCIGGAIFGAKLGAGAGAVIGAVAGGTMLGTEFLEAPFQFSTDIMNGEDGAFAVSNCAQMHRVIDARLAMTATQLDSFARDVEELQTEYQDEINAANPDFAALNPRAQTQFVLETARAAGEARCKGEVEGAPPYGGSEAECIARLNDQISGLVATNRNVVAEQSHPVARRMVENAADPRFQSPVRGGLAAVGGFLAPIGVFVKSAIGGFGAGTYSKIMPMVIAYATVMMIILTPIMYMIGLLIPTWAAGVMLMPIVVILYFQLTKIVFTMIGIIAGIFIAAEDSGIVTGNTAGFADLVLGFAYTSAFILTAFFMFALKNPIAAIQQTAGMADKTSTISGSEALGMALAGAKAISAIKAGPGAVAGALGRAKGAADSGQGTAMQLGAAIGMTPNDNVGMTYLQSRNDQMDAISDKPFNLERLQSLSKADHDAKAAGRFKKAEEEELVEIAKGRGASSMTHSQTAVVDRNGKKLEISADDAVRAISGALRKGGHDAKGSMLKMYDHASDKPGGNINPKGIYQVDKEALANQGAVRYNVEVSALNAGGVDSKGIQNMVDKGLGKLSDDGKHFIIEESAGSGPSIFDDPKK